MNRFLQLIAGPARTARAWLRRRGPTVLVALFVLWLPFSIAALLAIPVALVAIFQEDEERYAKDVLGAMDRVGAALVGWGYKYTISARCGATHSGCAFCRGVCWLLDLIDPGHCKGAAKHEGLSQ